ncbi:MAG: hypothetical protein BAJALOKI1v1_150002 [Promethearchaeota archaeon]|nr:MAG: hypothetical protein BAJALOKI1v1_150002 [Candidatus Lokiarchaeota archaeon]
MNNKELMADLLALFVIIGLLFYFIFLFPMFSRAIIEAWPQFAYLEEWIMFSNSYPITAFITYLILLIVLYLVLTNCERSPLHSWRG